MNLVSVKIVCPECGKEIEVPLSMENNLETVKCCNSSFAIDTADHEWLGRCRHHYDLVLIRF